MAGRFGVLLRDARRRAGLTQEGLAARAGVGVRTIRRLENGGGTDPRVGTVTLLADALGITPRERADLLAAADGRQPDEPVEVPSEDAGETPVVPAPSLVVVPDEVSEAADHLATIIATRLRREEELRRVHDPFPLPVRWRTAADLADHWDNICRVPHGMTAAPLDLSGEIGDIADIYRGIPSRKLVLLGRAGAGKTVLTLRFALDALAVRNRGGVVPVIFTIGSWDPTTTPLRTWLVETLQRDHPGLSAEAPGGSTLAAVLVDTGYILPVLDGFDEIAEGLHRPALEALNSLSGPLFLTSRFDEYERAVTNVHTLTSAAVVELTDLTVDDLAGYLPRTARRLTPGGAATAWDPVLAALRDTEAPAANLATVLKTPLMIGLARTVYSDSRDRDPASLLDIDRFPTAQALEEHLLDTFVPTVWEAGDVQQRWDLEQVRHWLGFLADDLDRRDTGDLEWWRMGGSLTRRSRVLLVTASTWLTTALVIWFVLCPLNSLTSGLPFRLPVVLVDGLASGAVIAVPFGLLYSLLVVRKTGHLEPTRVRLRLFDRRARRPRLRRRIAVRFAAGVAGGVLAAVVITFVGVFVRALSPDLVVIDDLGHLLRLILIDIIVFGLAFGPVCGGLLALLTVLEVPANLTTATSPADLLAANRSTVLRVVALFAPVFAIAIGLGAFGAAAALEDLTGPSFHLVKSFRVSALLGLTAGLVTASAYVMTFTAWGQWLVFARLRLPLLRKLPWAVTAFLDDAYRRGILRQSGAVYQFRHARLQQHLAKAYRARR
ncbi:helix-turn-helix domain-containing protein [Amycolatopsis roodepoortensis]|uniref:Transcriptional regulator with XRE-family HTH domain n=1 Tax=Amycolatopsis roodepoortensis TaxID=700274 RepID=A0ABR9L7Y3_9PSEU|nr:helix-turn-helix transcriptional regulator [Amycolatopsis roodepoortensis]MBE1576268.1 transcriptional regulator with XRE-family HTH domain [Amycolatopsis roodepoortensis]